MRCTMTSHGLSRFERESTQKSCPSGAPTRAAAACIAEMPGSTRTLTPRHDSGPSSIASTTAVDNAHVAPGQRQRDRLTRPLRFDFIVGAVSLLAGSHRNTIEVGLISH